MYINIYIYAYIQYIYIYIYIYIFTIYIYTHIHIYIYVLVCIWDRIGWLTIKNEGFSPAKMMSQTANAGNQLMNTRNEYLENHRGTNHHCLLA